MTSTGAPLRIVLFGDLHDAWDEVDDAVYPTWPADLFLWTGDLGHLDRTADYARRLSALSPRAFGVLGNHDGATTPHVIAEALEQDLVARAFAAAHVERVRSLNALLGERHLGFAVRDLPELGVSLVGMRPHSTGGDRMHFPRALSAVYGCVDPMVQHRRSIDAARFDDLIFLGHNGPRGLGAEPTSPFGVDFRPGGGDLGDPDYEAALGYARQQGRRVLLAVGGHMHDRLHRQCRHLGSRTLFGVLDGVPVVNACRTPRIERRPEERVRHHTECVVDREAERLTVRRVAWTRERGIIEATSLYDGPLSPPAASPRPPA